MINYSLLLFSFINGIILLSLEVISSKMIGSYFGTSYHVWGAMLLTTLISIALGYLISMKIIEKKLELKSLLFFVILQLILIVFILFCGDFILKTLLKMNFYVGLLISFIVLFLPLFVALCTQSPLLITLMGEKNGSSLVSKIFSISTLGGVLGIYFISFYFLPFYGVKTSILLVLCFNILNFIIISFQFKKRNVKA